MQDYFAKTKNYIYKHKFWSGFFLLIFLLLGYWIYGKATNTSTETRYVLASVTKGTIISSVSGSGQVSASDQIDIKPSVSGTITSVNVSPGDNVAEGKTLFVIDPTEANKNIRDAEINLETAKLNLAEFVQAPDSVSVLGFKQAIADAETSKTDADNTVKQAYRNLLNTSTVAMPSDISSNQTPPTISGTYTKDQEAIININVYQSGSGAYFSASSVPEGIVSGAGTVSTVTPQPIGDSGLYIKFSSSSPSSSTSWIINLPDKSATTYDANNTAYQNALSDQKKTDDAADLTIAQNNKSLNDLYQPDSFTLQTKQLAVEQAQNALDDAQTALSNYYIKAPFSGVVASIPVIKGDDASSGTVLGTIITSQQVAIISLNEVDVSKIALGEKATLTFDAIPDLTISGKVVQIDSLGTVSQGVVNYNVKINFDTSDARVKPGMSVNSEIITNVEQDVLTVPNGAVKNQGGTSYVQIFDTPLPPALPGVQGSPSSVPPINQNVETGISNDTSTEIVSGLNEGDQVVVRTITGTTTTATSSAPSILSAVGGNRGGGGAVRAIGR